MVGPPHGKEFSKHMHNEGVYTYPGLENTSWKILKGKTHMMYTEFTPKNTNTTYGITYLGGGDMKEPFQDKIAEVVMSNYIIPSISLGAAFALAAILSPTDAVAVKSITKGMKLPKGLMSILEGESLLNDAAGIVSFKIALASIITGTFSLSRSSREFFITAIGGMFLGILIGLIIVSIKLC